MKQHKTTYDMQPQLSLGRLTKWAKATLPGAFTTSPMAREIQAHNKDVDAAKAAKRPWKTIQ